MEEEGERGKGKICRREQGDGREDAGPWQGTKRRKSGGGMRVDGKLDGRHSTNSKEECGERVKAEAKKMARNTQYTQDHLAPVEDVPFVLSHDGLRH